MRNDKHLAAKLRHQGKSYSHISQALDLPKSTISDWFSEKKWSQSIKAELTRKAKYFARKRLLFFNKKRRVFWEQWREKAQRSQEKVSISNEEPPICCGLNALLGRRR